MVTLHPFLSDFLHWRTRRTHRLTTLCRACGHTAHAVRPSSCQFLMGLRVECIRMEEQLLLLENPLLKVLLLEDERSDWVNPIFDEREKCCKFQTLFPMLLEQAQQFFQYFRMGPGTFWYILHNINFLESTRNEYKTCMCLARNHTTHWHTRPEKNKMIWFRPSVGETCPCASPLRPSPLTETHLFVLPLSAVYVNVRYRPNTHAVWPQTYARRKLTVQ